jgi:hypothetical protein
LLVTFFMAWSPGRRFNAGDSRLITTETTPTSIPTNPATGPRARPSNSARCHLNYSTKRELVFNDFWTGNDDKPATFVDRLNQAEAYLNERLTACGESWQGCRREQIDATT